MRIEERLTEAYREAAGRVTIPNGIDARVGRRIGASRSGGRRTGGRRGRTKWLVLASLLALLVMGFTAQYFVKIGDGRLSLELSVTDRIRFDPVTAAAVRDQLREVKSRLAVGEKALVYSKEIRSFLPEPWDKEMHYAEYVSNPVLHTDAGEWRARLASYVPGLLLPDEKENGLAFVNGTDEFAYGGVVLETDVVKRLNAKVEEEGETLAWEKIVRDEPLFPAYTTLYEDPAGNEIKVTMQVVAEKSKYVGLSKADQEKLVLKGREAVFSVNDSHYFSDTNRYASLSWIDSQPDASVLYTVGSSSPSVDKEELVSIAETMLEP